MTSGLRLAHPTFESSYQQAMNNISKIDNHHEKYELISDLYRHLHYGEIVGYFDNSLKTRVQALIALAPLISTNRELVSVSLEAESLATKLALMEKNCRILQREIVNFTMKSEAVLSESFEELIEIECAMVDAMNLRHAINTVAPLFNKLRANLFHALSLIPDHQTRAL